MDIMVLLKIGKILVWIMTGLSFCMFIWSIMMKKALYTVIKVKEGSMVIADNEMSEMQRKAINMSEADIEKKLKNSEELTKMAIMLATNALIILSLLKFCF